MLVGLVQLDRLDLRVTEVQLELRDQLVTQDCLDLLATRVSRDLREPPVILVQLGQLEIRVRPVKLVHLDSWVSLVLMAILDQLVWLDHLDHKVLLA